MTKSWKLAALVSILALQTCPVAATSYYIDSVNGSDSNSGTSSSQPWKTIPKIQGTALSAGDFVLFARGSSYSQCFYVDYAGASGSPITIGTYGTGAAPAFTNATFGTGELWQLHPDSQRLCDGRWPLLLQYGCRRWRSKPILARRRAFGVATGAVNIESGCDNCTVQNCEFYDCVAAIRTRGQYTLAQYNIYSTTVARDGAF